ncbi:MAG: DUF2339 domain-containing protein, partial [Sphingopyxis sp.]
MRFSRSDSAPAVAAGNPPAPPTAPLNQPATAPVAIEPVAIEPAPPTPVAITAPATGATHSAPPQTAPAKPAHAMADADADGDTEGDAGAGKNAGKAWNFEEIFGRKLPIWAGGITLAIAGVMIVKYAIDAGVFGRLFTPWVQVITGLLFGAGLIGGAEWAHRHHARVNDPRVGQALSGAGISTLYAAFLVAANIYHLVHPLVAFFGLAAVTALALWLALRHGAPTAVLGLAGGLAAPALTGSLAADAPLVSAYMAFAIAGLVGVSRVQRWPWLALMALMGGAGWSLWLIVAGALDSTVDALSGGGLIFVLAIGLPIIAFDGARAAVMRAASALAGAAQLALLVALGGFQPLHWGLFVLVAMAGQWLAWRSRDFAVVPTLGAVLSTALLLMWPAPAPFWLALIGGALLIIHAGPLLARLWHAPLVTQRAVEYCGLAVAVPAVTLCHYHAPWGAADLLGAWAALGGAAMAAIGAARGWAVPLRHGDRGFSLLLGVGAALLCAAAWLALPHWQAPLWIGAVAAGLLALARPSGDAHVEPLAAGFMAIATWAMGAGDFAIGAGQPGFAPMVGHELAALVGGQPAPLPWMSHLRWAGLGVAFGVFAWRSAGVQLRLVAHFAAAIAIYGCAAQFAPAWSLPGLGAAIVAGALAALQLREDAEAEKQVATLMLGAIGLLCVTGAAPWVALGRMVGVDGSQPMAETV